MDDIEALFQREWRKLMRVGNAAAELGEVGRALITEFQADGDTGALDRAIIAFERAAELWKPSDTHRADYLMWASAALRDRYRLTADRADLERSVARGREAAAVDGDGDPPYRQANLVESLRHSYQATGVVAFLRELVELQAKLVNVPKHDRFALQTLPANAHMLFRRTNRREHLDLAVSIGRRSLTAATGPVDRALRYANLALCLRTRYESFGQHEEDLTEAAEASHEALRGLPSGSADRLAAAANHVLILQQIWQHFGDPEALDEAVDTARAVVGATPEDDPEHAARCSNLAAVLMDRYHRTTDLVDLTASVDAARDAVRTCPHGDLRGWHYDLALAIGLGARFRATGDETALETAVDMLTAIRQTLLETSPDEAGLYNVTTMLGRLTAQRSPDAGLALLREASRMPAATHADRLSSAVDAATLAMARRQPDVALAAYRDAVDLLPTVVWHGFTRESRERRITGHALLGPDAAASAVAAGDALTALALLESGRSLLWTQTVRRRAVIGALDRVSPDIAARLSAIAEELGEPTTGTAP
jgi:hypothetical protein